MILMGALDHRLLLRTNKYRICGHSQTFCSLHLLFAVLIISSSLDIKSNSKVIKTDFVSSTCLNIQKVLLVLQRYNVRNKCVTILKTLTKFNQQVSAFVSLFTKLTVSLTSKQQLKFRITLAHVFDKKLLLQFIFFLSLNLSDRHTQFLTKLKP